MSAKLKLTAWMTLQMLLFTAFVIVFLCVVYGEAITDDPQGRLVTVVEENAHDLEYENGAFEWEDLKYYKNGVYTVCCDINGSVLHGSAPEDAPVDIPFTENSVRTRMVNDTEYLIYDVYQDMGFTGIWVRGFIDSSNRSGVMHTFTVLVCVLVPTMFVIAIGGGWFISWNAFRPIEKMIDTADSISEGNDLNGRIGLKKGSKELKKLSHTFDKMFERLVKSFNSEKQFASDASHELRTPITVILAECDRAHRKNKTIDDYEETIRVIEEQGHCMSDLVNQLLSLTRIEQGTERYPLTEVNISDLVTAYVEEFRAPLERGITLTTGIEEEIYAKCNSTLICSVLQNLLTNAYKYGRDNGHINLELKSHGLRVSITVTDDGIGISSEDISHVFNRFWQADPSRGVDGGSGLGLSMVKEIAELHKGTVDAESTLGQGTSFIFSIPRIINTKK